MNRHFQQLVSRHTTQWFQRVGVDEVSPALMISDVSSRLLHYIASRNLFLNVPERDFRKYMCEFLCTSYIAHKRNVEWRGPLSKPYRPPGWTQQQELEWQEYLTHEFFSSEFWIHFWSHIPEAFWESKVPNWRNHIQWVLLHYINVQSDKMDDDDSDSHSYDTE
jgi:hypothetical protein